MPEDISETYKFGPFHYDARQQRLRKGGEDIELTPTLCKILHLFVQRAGERLPKDDILAAVWGDTPVTEENLPRNISTLRMALEDDPTNPIYIKTIQRFGYEFIAPVTKPPTAQGPTPLPPPDTNAILDPHLPPPPTIVPRINAPLRRQRYRWLLLGLALVVVLLGVFWWQWPIDPHILTVQLLGCDDVCVLSLNGAEILRTTMGEPATPWHDITSLLRPGENHLRLQVTNTGGAIAYGLRIKKGGLIVVHDACGVAHKVGCNDNQTYPTGPVMDILHTFHK